MKNGEKIVKEYDIRIIASIMENGMLCDNIEQVFDFSQNLINKEVDILNFKDLQKEIVSEINKQYPNIKRYNYYPTGEYIEDYCNSLIKMYRSLYGDTLKFEVYNIKKKSLKSFHFKYKK